MTLNLEVPFEMLDYGVASSTIDVTFVRSSTYIDPAWFDGTRTWYFEIDAKNSDASTAQSVALWDGASEVASISIPANTTTTTRLRSSAFSEPSGAKTFQVRTKGTSPALETYAYSARVIVKLVGASKAAVQIPLSVGTHDAGGNADTNTWASDQLAGTTYGQGYADVYGYWKYVASEWDDLLLSGGNHSWEFHAVLSNSASAGTSYAQLYNADAGSAMGTQVSKGGTALGFLRAACTGNFTNNTLYEARIKSSSGSRTCYLYHACLIVFVGGASTDFNKLNTYWTVNRSDSVTGGGYSTEQRQQLNHSNFSNPKLYLCFVGFSDATDVHLIDAGTNDSGTSGSEIGTITPGVSRSWNISSELTKPTSGNRLIFLSDSDTSQVVTCIAFAVVTVDVSGGSTPRTADTQGSASVLQSRTADTQGSAAVRQGRTGDTQGSATVVLAPTADTQGSATILRPRTGDTQGSASVLQPRTGDTQGSATLRVPRTGDTQGSATIQVPRTGDTQGSATIRVPRTGDTQGSATIQVPQTGDTAGSAGVAESRTADTQGSASVLQPRTSDTQGSATIASPATADTQGSATVQVPQTGDTQGSATIKTRVVTSGLVGEWVATNADHDQTPHTNSDDDKGTWFDLLGEHDGTLNSFDYTGTSGWAEASPDALVFDGTEVGVTVGDTGACSNWNVTYEGWVKHSVSHSGVIYAESSAWVFASLCVEYGAIALRAYVSGGPYIYVPRGSGVADGQWHHCVLTVGDYTNARLYIDGIQQGDVFELPSAVPPSEVDNADIGVSNRRGGSGVEMPLQGQLRGVRVYDRALTADEVRVNFGAGPDGRSEVRFNDTQGSASVQQLRTGDTQGSATIVISGSYVADTQGSASVLQPRTADTPGSAGIAEAKTSDTQGSASISQEKTSDTQGSATVLQPRTSDTEGSATVLQPRTSDVQGSAAVLQSRTGDTSGSGAVAEAKTGDTVGSATVLQPRTGDTQGSATIVIQGAVTADTPGSATILVPRTSDTQGSAAVRKAYTGDTEGSATVQVPRTSDTQGSATVVIPHTADTQGSATVLQPRTGDTQGSATIAIVGAYTADTPGSATVQVPRVSDVPGSAAIQAPQTSDTPGSASVRWQRVGDVDGSSTIQWNRTGDTSGSGSIAEAKTTDVQGSATLAVPRTGDTPGTACIVAPVRADITVHEVELAWYIGPPESDWGTSQPRYSEWRFDEPRS